MGLGIFVNPAPDLKAEDLVQFDFPADYCATGMLPNINIAPPGIEQIYGTLGTPPKEQGHPIVKEATPEAEDPNVTPYQDQIIDIDRNARIYHTGRLSGSLARFLESGNFESRVKIAAMRLTDASEYVTIDTIVRPLTAVTEAENVWFYRDPSTRAELLFTAYVEFDPSTKGLLAGNLYKLTFRWEFWDVRVTPNQRMPISGFDETVTIEVCEATM